MNTRVTLVVLIIAALAAGYFVVFESGLIGDKDDTGPTNASSQSGDPLFKTGELPPTGVTRVALKLGDHEPVVADRTGDGAAWQQTEPFEFAVNGYLFDALVNDAAALRYFSRDKIGDDAKTLGLEPPRHVITLTGDREGKPFEHTLKLGRTGAAGRAYLSIDDSDAVYLVDATLHRQLGDREPGDYRSKLLPEVAAQTVERITLVQGEQTVTLQRHDAAWALTAPLGGRASESAATELIGTFGRTPIDGFVKDAPDNLSRYGLDTPTLELQLHERTEDNETPASHTLRIGSAADLAKQKYYAQIAGLPAVFTLRSGDVDKLRRTADNLRDPRLTPTRHGDLREIAVEPGAGQPLRFELTSGRWAFGEPKPGFNIESTAVTEMIDSLLIANADRYEQADADGTHDLTVKLVTAGGTGTEVLRIKRGETHDAVVRDDEPVAYMVERGELDRLFAGALAYRSRQVLSVVPAQIERLTVVHTGGVPARHELAKTDGRWQLEGFERNAIDTLVGVFNPLRCRQWVELAEAPSYDLTVDITDAGGQKHTLQVNTRQLIGTVGNGHFVLDAATVDLLAAELRHRDLLAVSIDDIASVAVGGKTYHRSAEGRYTLEGGGELDEAKVGALFDTLAGLRAQRYVPGAWTEQNAAAPAELGITLRNGDSHALLIWAAGSGKIESPIGRLGDKSFMLRPASAEALVALSR